MSSGTDGAGAPIADAPNLRSLIALLEAATEGSRELDAEIWLTFNRRNAQIIYNNASFGLPKPLPQTFAAIPAGIGRGALLNYARPYTTSIDAALTLVPEGCAPLIVLGGIWADHMPRAGQPIWEAAIVEYTAFWEETLVGDICHFKWSATGATGALALCIAALKARQAAGQGGRTGSGEAASVPNPEVSK